MNYAELTFTPTVKAKGRNVYNADAIRFDLLDEGSEGKFLYIQNRVASTGLYNMGWACVPGDPLTLRMLANNLTALADSLEEGKA